MPTWAQQHSWFNPPVMKRRQSANDDDDDASLAFDVSPSTFSASRRKRVRYSSLERTLAHMTLGSALATPSEDVNISPKTSPRPRVQNDLNLILPSSIEEPGSPAPEPVDMEVEPTGKSCYLLIDTSFSTAVQMRSGHHRRVCCLS